MFRSQFNSLLFPTELAVQKDPAEALAGERPR